MTLSSKNNKVNKQSTTNWYYHATILSFLTHPQVLYYILKNIWDREHPCFNSFVTPKFLGYFTTHFNNSETSFIYIFYDIYVGLTDTDNFFSYWAITYLMVFFFSFSTLFFSGFFFSNYAINAFCF